MLTRLEIAPAVDRRRFAETVRVLTSAGRISPASPAPGRPASFTTAEAEIIAEALGVRTPRPDTPQRPDTPSGQASVASGHPAGETATPAELPPALVVELAELRLAIRQAEESRAAEAEQRARESAELRAELDREAHAREAATTTALLAREEAALTRARIARLERERRAPRGLWARVRAAWGVLRGETAAVPALPAPREEIAA